MVWYNLVGINKLGLNRNMRKILVIGASGGIGNTVSEVLLQNEDEVVGTFYQHPENLKNLKDIPNFTEAFVDLKNLGTIVKLKEKFATDAGKLFAIVNCAGIVRFEGKSLDQDIDIWQETIAVNLSGNYYLAKIFSDNLLENGRFIMTSSTDAFFGGSITTSYAASKAGTNSLVKSLSLAMKDRKIRVNAVAPGWVETPMALLNGRDYLNKVASINPLNRNAQPLDIAQTIKFLLSEDAEFINGQTISVEGGYTNQDPTLLLEEDVQK